MGNALHQRAIVEATSLKILASIALEILNEVSARRSRPVVQVCGPISTGGFGAIDKNLAVFKIGIRVLNERGYNVFDQTIFQESIIRITNFNPDDTEYRTEILHDFFARIFHSGHITSGYFIPGWRSSTGSLWEHQLLTQLEIPCIEMRKDWFFGTFAH